MSFAEDEFDMATAIEVLEHVPDPAHTVAEMARVARGGHLLVQDQDADEELERRRDVLEQPEHGQG